MKREIEWKTPGSDKVHTIPDVARVTLTGKHGKVTIGFDEDGSIEYGKHEFVGVDETSFYGNFLFASEFGREAADRRYAAIVEGSIRATDYLYVFLHAMSPESREDALVRIVEQVLESHPKVADEFRKRLRLEGMSKGPA